jgi:uncharacterized membrane protein
MAYTLRNSGMLQMRQQGDFSGLGVLGAIFGVIATIFVIVLTFYVIMLIIELFKKNHITSSKNKSRPPFPMSPAIALLDERFAKGEISEADYQHMKMEILKKMEL